MEDLVHDLPLTIDFEQREQVGETKTGPVFKLKSHGRDGTSDIDAGDSVLEFRRRTVVVIPCEKVLDGSCEQIGSDIAEDGCVLVESGLHVVAFAGSGTIDVVLDDLGDNVILADVGRGITHVCYTFISVVRFVGERAANFVR